MKLRPKRIPVGFTGTQDGMSMNQCAAVKRLLSEFVPTVGVHGDDLGADRDFHLLCESLGIPTWIYPPSNPKRRAFCRATFGQAPAPYLERNKSIVRHCEVLIACPKEAEGEALRSGTWMTIRWARRLGRPVIIIRPDGSSVVEENADEGRLV